MAKMELPPDFVFETDENNKLKPQYDISESENSSSDDPDDAARTGKLNEEKNLKRKHNKVVTFANTEHLKQIEDDDEEEEEETEEQRYMRMRLKRSGSLPSIELNRELARKIRRMLKEEQNNADEVLTRQLYEGLKLSQEIDKSTSEVKFEYEFSHGQVLQVRLGDITEEMVDVMVNEANSNLTHNSGVSGVIAQKGGREIQHLSDRWIRKHGPVPPGQVAVTEAGRLPCKWLIHAVGPLYVGANSGKQDTELFDAMWNSLVWASKLQARSIAIPLIGAGFLGFQKERCSYLLVDCVAKFFRKHTKSTIHEIRIVNHNDTLCDSVVFEMVGKFTSGCETSESERDEDYFDEEEEEEEEEEETEVLETVLEEEEEGHESNALNGNGGDASLIPKKLPTKQSLVHPKSPKSVIKEHVAPSWIPSWRRQSIA